MYPGLAWDGVAHEFVAWIGGSRVFVIDADAETCREESYPGDPGPARETGTNGRFRYFPSRDVFALVNAFEQDAFVLRRRGE